MQKPTLYIMCGLPYSGKSVLAKQLSKKFELEMVSIDDIRESRGFIWEKNDKVTTSDWDEIFDKVYNQIRKALRTGKSVIYDSANQDRASRDKLRAIAAESKSQAKVVFVNVPEKIIRERWQQNQLTKERFHLPEKWLQAAINTFEAPTEDENVIHDLSIML